MASRTIRVHIGRLPAARAGKLRDELHQDVHGGDLFAGLPSRTPPFAHGAPLRLALLPRHVNRPVPSTPPPWTIPLCFSRWLSHLVGPLYHKPGGTCAARKLPRICTQGFCYARGEQPRERGWPGVVWWSRGVPLMLAAHRI